MHLNKNIELGFLDDAKGFGFGAVKGRTEFWFTKAKARDFKSSCTYLLADKQGYQTPDMKPISDSFAQLLKECGVDYCG